MARIYTDWKYPTSFSGSTTPTNPENAYGSDGVYATASVSGYLNVLIGFVLSGATHGQDLPGTTMSFDIESFSEIDLNSYTTEDLINYAGVKLFSYDDTNTLASMQYEGVDFSEIPLDATITGLDVRIEHKLESSVWSIDSVSMRMQYFTDIVTNAVSSITSTTADANGEIIATGGGDVTERGFVYDTVSRSRPVVTNTPSYTDSFEGGTLGDFTTSGNVNWSVVTNESNDGSNSVKAGGITDNQESILSLIKTANKIEFDYKVSSEGNYDFLEFYEDGVLIERWSGTVVWATFSYTTTNAEHTFEWKYTKDGSVLNGSDTAWVDNVKVSQETPVPSPASSLYGSVESETGTFGIGTYSLGLTGLIESTTYYVRAYAKNLAGYSYSNSERSFTAQSPSPYNPAFAHRRLLL